MEHVRNSENYHDLSQVPMQKPKIYTYLFFRKLEKL